MKLKFITIALLSAFSFGCSQLTTDDSENYDIEDLQIEETSENLNLDEFDSSVISTEFMDPLEKVTYLIYNNKDNNSNEQRDKVIKACNLSDSGLSEAEFQYFVRFAPSKAPECLDEISNFFLTSPIKDADLNNAFEEFNESVGAYQGLLSNDNM